MKPICKSVIKCLGCLIAGHDWCDERCQHCGKDQPAGDIGIDYAVRCEMRKRGFRL